MTIARDDVGRGGSREVFRSKLYPPEFRKFVGHLTKS